MRKFDPPPKSPNIPCPSCGGDGYHEHVAEYSVDGDYWNAVERHPCHYCDETGVINIRKKKAS